MAKIDLVTIDSQRTWVDLGKEQIFEISAANTGAVDVYLDFAIGPDTLVNTGSDTNAIYFIQDVNIPPGATLILDSQFLSKTITVGQNLYLNTVSAGKRTRTELIDPTYLIRTGDTNINEAVDIIVVRK